MSRVRLAVLLRLPTTWRGHPFEERAPTRLAFPPAWRRAPGVLRETLDDFQQLCTVVAMFAADLDELDRFAE